VGAITTLLRNPISYPTALCLSNPMACAGVAENGLYMATGTDAPMPVVPLAGPIAAETKAAGTVLKTETAAAKQIPNVAEDIVVPAVRVEANAAKTATSGGSIWSMEAKQRGVLVENSAAANEYKDWFRVGQLDNGKFPLIDFQKGDDLVSLKSVDTSGVSWMRDMQKHIDDLSTRGATINDRPARMILDLRVPPGGNTAQSGSAKGFKELN
jgi:hypothetical protein